MPQEERLPRPPRVLIVDDSRAIQAIIRRALEGGVDDDDNPLPPLQIDTADDGAAALDRVAAERPDLVLSDWHMPNVGGLQLLQALRRGGHADLPVGIVTTETRAERLHEARRRGARFVLPKPFDDRALRRAVAGLLPQRAGGPALEVPELPRGSAIDSLAQLQQQLYMHLGTRGFDLRRAEQDAGLAERPTQLVALYGSAGRNGPYAIGLLDASACWLVGGIAAGASSAEIQAGMAAGLEPGPRLVDQAGRFMRACAAQLRKRSASDVPALSAVRLARQRFERLPELMARNSGRSEFSLRLPGLGQGRLAFLLV
ncbi:response regulator [Roseateles sp. DAIF2]|nr:response regulator [Roseateles sp. DAIF2]